MKICLAAIQNRLYVLDDYFKAYPSAVANKQEAPIILESFYYMNSRFARRIKDLSFFMLDSGAFTIFNSKTGKVDWDEYACRYADFINEYDIDNFFELDIDAVVGLAKVKQLRKLIESRTGKQCIPVWHRSRGKQEWLDMIKEYPYVSIGVSGKSDSKWSITNPELLKWFIGTAHEAGRKIHGLGFTRLTMLDKYQFDSVDSTAWVSGSRFGYLYYFDGKNIRKIEKPANHNISDFKKITSHNFIEWTKFQKLALRRF